MINIDNDNYEEMILKQPGLSIVDFWAEWCGPCKMFAPVFLEVSQGFKNVQFAKLNVDEAGEVAEQLGIRSIPTVVFFKDGVEIDRFSGAIPKEDFVGMVQEHVQ